MTTNGPQDPRAAVTRHESPPATVTLRMVAAHAGVSKSVVSRVLQDSPHVSPAKRAAVAAAIEELGYRPNSLARSLTQRRTNIVGVLVHDLRQPWFVDALEGLGAGLAPTGLLPFIADGRLDRTLDDRVVRSFMGLRLDGFILAGSVPETASVVAAMESIPSVAVGGRDITRPGVDLVAQDDVLGARLALDHLHDLGHRRIAHVAGAVGRSFDLRRQTYLAWMAEQGLAASRGWRSRRARSRAVTARRARSSRPRPGRDRPRSSPGTTPSRSRPCPPCGMPASPFPGTSR